MKNAMLTPIRIGSVKIKNMLVFLSPRFSFCGSDSYLSETMPEYVRCRANDCAELCIVTGNPHGYRSIFRPALSDDQYIPDWKHFSDVVHQHRAILFRQIHPVKIQVGIGDDHDIENPDDNTEVDIEKISTRYNMRTDKFVSSHISRFLFPEKIIQAIKKVCGKYYPVIFRTDDKKRIPESGQIDETAKMATLFIKKL